MDKWLEVSRLGRVLRVRIKTDTELVQDGSVYRYSFFSDVHFPTKKHFCLRSSDSRDEGIHYEYQLYTTTNKTDHCRDRGCHLLKRSQIASKMFFVLHI